MNLPISIFLRRTAAFVACALFASTAVAKKFAWTELVTIHDGRVVTLERVVERHDGRATLPGSSSMIGQSVEVRMAGQRVIWKDDLEHPYLMPVIFEMAGDDPVIVTPVYGFPGCEHYDFPPEGLAALRWRNGTWTRMPLADLPPGTRKNLLPSPEMLEWPEYRGRTVDDVLRRKIDYGLGSPGNPEDLAGMSRIYSGYESSCRHLHPPADPAADAAREHNAVAERAAAVASRLVEESTEPRAVSRQEYLRTHGNKWVRDNCAGLVDRVETVSRTAGSKQGHSISAMGYRVYLVDEGNKPGRLDFGYSNAPVQPVACEKGVIYVLRRIDATQLVLHRFRADGTLIDAHRIVLAGAERMGRSHGWGGLWEVIVQEGGLSLVLADYDYSGTANQGGTIVHRQVYAVNLPPPP